MSKTPLPKVENASMYGNLEAVFKSFSQPVDLNQVSLLIGINASAFHVMIKVKLGESPEPPIAVRTERLACISGER